MQILNIHRV